MSSTVLVVGAGGFIGRHLVERFAVDGFHVRAITRGEKGLDHQHVQWSVDEAPSIDAWRAMLDGVGLVVYLASASTPAGSAGRPVAEANHLAHLLTLLEAMQADASIRLVYVSSAGSLYSPADGKPSNETDPIAPRSYHGASKAAAEAFVGSWCAQFNATATVIRPSNVYGPGQVAKPGFGVIPNAFWHMRNARSMDVWGDGSQTRDYIYIDDLIDLCLAAAGRSHPGLEIYNAASGRSTSLNELFEVVEDVSGLVLPRVYHEPRAVDARHVAVDASKALAHFGWSGQTPLQKGVRETWRWYRSTVE